MLPAAGKMAPSSGTDRTMDATQGNLIEAGGTAPEFTLQTHDGRTVSSSDFAGKQNIVLFFYPKADTGG